ncbi:MAG TPA: ankyrin repeat domain-containing protein [Ramlibacter sp.]|nr:ankyrin repeat domain-containing protein [Ramlibacter sp.]
MRKYIRICIYLVVIAGYSLSRAGSYEDFFAALKQDDPQAVKALLNRGFDPNTLDPKRLPGLYVALRDSSLKAAQALIDWPKTNVEMRTPEDESPLMMACLKGHIEMVRKLISRDADVNKTGWTPLHYAATGGHVAIIELLLEQHAYIDAASPNGTTPLMMAAHYGSPAAVKVLLEAGADPSLKNHLGLTAIDFANRASRPDAVEMIAARIRASGQKGKW